MKARLLLGLCVTVAACGEAPSQPKSPQTNAPVPSATRPAAPVSEAPDRGALPKPVAVPAWAPPKPEIFSLSNGMKVYFVQQGPTPLVSVLLLFPRGAASDPKGKAGLTALTADLLDEGAGGKDALALSEELQRLGTDYSASADVDSVLLAMNTIADSLEPSVKILADIARKPALDAKEFARRKEQRIADALAAESEPSSARAIVLREVLFGDGYGSWLASGTRPTLGRIGLQDVKAQYGKLFVPEGAAFIVVGGVEAAPVQRALEASFGDWQGRASAKPAALSTKPPDKGVFIIDFPGTTQSSVTVARTAPGETTPDYFPAMIMSRVLGEAFTSRLNLNLREAKGYTYGASSSFRRWRDAGLFALSASVKRETTRPSVDAMLEEVRDLCGSRPITGQERDEAVGGLLLGFPGRFERGAGVADQLSALPLYARPDDWLEKWPERVKAVDVASVNQVAKGYCNPDDFVVVIAGDREIVEPTLDGLGRKIFYYDAQGTRLSGPPKRAAKPAKKADGAAPKKSARK
jgi:zinc protease